MKNKSTKVSLIALGLVGLSVVYVSAFTLSVSNDGKKSGLNVASKSLTATGIGSTTMTNSATATSIGTSTGIGVNVAEEIAGISVYPNPVTDKLNVKYSSEAASVTQIKVLSVSGAVVYQCEKADFIDLSKFAPGTYFVQFVDNDMHTTTKSIIKAENSAR